MDNCFTCRRRRTRGDARRRIKRIRLFCFACRSGSSCKALESERKLGLVKTEHCNHVARLEEALQECGEVKAEADEARRSLRLVEKDHGDSLTRLRQAVTEAGAFEMEALEERQSVSFVKSEHMDLPWTFVCFVVHQG